MERIFGIWYEDKLTDAAVKTVALVIVVYLLVWVYNILGGRPVMNWSDFPVEAVALVIIVAFGAFYYASSEHRKYRHHLQQHAHKLTSKMHAKKRK